MNKSSVADLLVGANAFAPFRYLNRDKVLVLMYHRFSEGDEFGKTSARTFERHLAYLAANYNIISLEQAVDRLKEGSSLPPRSAVITIDDGYRDFYEIAFPILQKFNSPATLYVVTDFIDRRCWIWTDIARYVALKTNKDRVRFRAGEKIVERQLDSRESRLSAAGAVNSEVKKMPDGEKDAALREFAAEMNVEVPDIPPEEFGPVSWESVSDMDKRRVEIGSHTVSHPILTNVDDGRLFRELERSRSVIRDRLQKDRIHFCYPNGNVAARERDAVEAAGFASAVTTEIRLCQNGEDRFLIPRIDAEPEMRRFVQATSGFDKLKSKVRS